MKVSPLCVWMLMLFVWDSPCSQVHAATVGSQIAAQAQMQSSTGTTGIADAIDSIVRSLRRMFTAFRFRAFRFMNENIVSSMIYILMVLVISATILIAVLHSKSRLKVAGWFEVDGDARANIVWLFISTILVMGAMLLWFLPYVYRVLVHLRQPMSTAIGTDLKVDDAFRILEPYVSKPLDNLLRETESGAFMCQNSEWKTALLHSKTIPQVISFDEWNNKTRDRNFQDPIRVLIKFFHPEIVNQRTSLDSVRQQLEGKIGSQIETLRLAYHYRVAQFRLRVIRYMMTQTDEVFVMDHHVMTEFELQRRLNMLVHELKDSRKKLHDQLKDVWGSMQQEYKHRMEDKDDPLRASLEDGQHWATQSIALAVFADVMRRFLGERSDCPNLTNNDATRSARQYMTWYTTPDERETYPYIHHVASWACGTDCTLVCEPGYAPFYGVTTCQRLGAIGFTWSHLGWLNSGTPRPACCADNALAGAVSNYTVAINGTAYQINYRSTQGFSTSCGANQTLIVQKCAVDSSKSKWVNMADCNVACDLTTSDTSKCSAEYVMGRDDFATVYVKEFASTDNIRLSMPVTPLNRNAFRLVYINAQRAVQGSWVFPN